MAKVSVIIPVYNAAPYLRKCIDSVLAQTLTDIEVILVDDGSVDGSGDICDDYADGEKVIVIHQEHSGASAARNAALRIARGKYLGFVDADDYIEQDMYACLYQLAKEHDLDIALGNYSIVKGADKIPNTAYMTEHVILRKADIAKLIVSEKSSYVLWFVWKSIFRRELITEKHIVFREGMLGEDTVFDLEALLYATSVCFINKCFYNYVQTPNSLIRTKYKIDLIKKLNNNYLAKKQLFEQHGLADRLFVLCDYTMYHSLPMLFSNELEHNIGIQEKCQEYRVMLKTEMIRDAIKLSSVWKIRSVRYRVYAILLIVKCYWLLSLLTTKELDNNEQTK